MYRLILYIVLKNFILPLININQVEILRYSNVHRKYTLILIINTIIELLLFYCRKTFIHRNREITFYVRNKILFTRRKEKSNADK